MWSKILKKYYSYRADSLNGNYKIPFFFKLSLGLAGGAFVTLLCATGATQAVLPWIVIGLGFIASLDALGAAFYRGFKVEGLIRFCLINALFSGIGIWILVQKW